MESFIDNFYFPFSQQRLSDVNKVKKIDCMLNERRNDKDLQNENTTKYSMNFHVFSMKKMPSFTSI